MIKIDGYDPFDEKPLDVRDDSEDNPQVIEAEVKKFTMVTKPKKKLTEVRKAKVEAAIAVLDSGGTIKDAAKAGHIPYNEISKDLAVANRALDLIRGYKMTAEMRKSLTRAKLNQILLDGDTKDSLAAAKIISEDPEVALTSHAPQATINLGVFGDDTKVVLDNLPELKGWDKEEGK
jgi:hypothetical protein